MAFQMRMPIPLEERADDKKNVTSPTGLFGMNDLMKDTWDKFDDIIDNLLNFQTSHYFAFDEALEIFGVKFIKQNITGNVVDDNKLKLQVKAVQSERDHIEILLSEYFNDPCESIGQRAVETHKTAMWKLVNELLSAFEHSDNYNHYQNPLWSTTSSDQITAASIERLENCFSDGILRIEAIFLQIRNYMMETY
ncbi:hypothetical protein C1646_748562 [Rhizophagus diaphanus]|nr:hypothetical protein C1646_748562 [Rhizophagus diaphanus] [Rhizophagus sp. MUCL 43196]